MTTKTTAHDLEITDADLDFASNVLRPEPVPGSAEDVQRKKINLIFRELRALNERNIAEGWDANLRAIIMIEECIKRGIDKGKRITGVLEKLGFNKQHAGMMLDKNCGDDPIAHEWWQDEFGFYNLHTKPNA